MQRDMNVDRVKLTNEIFYSRFSQVGMIFFIVNLLAPELFFKF